MKKTLLFINFLLISFFSFSQNPTLSWVKQMGGKLNDRAIPIGVDANGNVFVAGYFNDTSDFDPGANKFNLISAGKTDVYITKLDSTGTFVWAKQIGGKEHEQANSIAVDGNGNIYVAGTYNDTVDFDPGNGVSKLISAGDADAFITKLDNDGNFVWARTIGGTQNDAGLYLFAKGTNVYLTGHFQGTTSFDIATGITNVTSAGNSDVFVTKLDEAGTYAWFKKMGGTTDDAGQSITVDKDGNVIITGSFTGTADFNPGVTDTLLTSAGSNDIFISKLNSSGDYVWVKQFGATNTDVGLSVNTDGNGDIVSTGYFGGTVDYDPNGGIQNVSSKGFFDIYVLKLNAAGNFVWVKQLGGASTDRGASIVTDLAGNVYSTGYFGGSADFDPSLTANNNLVAGGSSDTYISKLDILGNFVWARNFGGPSDDYGTSLVLDNKNHVYATGFFSQTANFDPNGTFNLTAAGSYDIFIQKLKDIPLQSSDNDVVLTDKPITIYPNPASDVIQVSLQNISAGKVSITDLQGYLVYQTEISATDLAIQTSTLVNGIYLLTVSSDQVTSVHKVVIAR